MYCLKIPKSYPSVEWLGSIEIQALWALTYAIDVFALDEQRPR